MHMLKKSGLVRLFRSSTSEDNVIPMGESFWHNNRQSLGLGLATHRKDATVTGIGQYKGMLRDSAERSNSYIMDNQLFDGIRSAIDSKDRDGFDAYLDMVKRRSYSHSVKILRLCDYDPGSKYFGAGIAELKRDFEDAMRKIRLVVILSDQPKSFKKWAASNIDKRTIGLLEYFNSPIEIMEYGIKIDARWLEALGLLTQL